MTYTDVYIASLSDGPDPLDWGGDYRIGNTPARIGPFFPPAAASPFFKVITMIKRNEITGKQIDWGAWAARMSKPDILAFIDLIYKDDRTYLDPAYMPHLYPKLAELKDLVRDLPDKDYALVAVEL